MMLTAYWHFLNIGKKNTSLSLSLIFFYQTFDDIVEYIG